MKRQKVINFRLSEKERQAVEVLAKREGLSISEVIRSSVREELKRHGLPPVGLAEMAAVFEPSPQALN